MSPTKSANESSGDDYSSTGLPIKPIPGSYGLPFLSPIRDRLDFYYFQGHEAFFQSRVSKYQSTVFRVNMPPGYFMASDPRVVAVLDAKSFPVLFDLSLVNKTDVLTGTYVPSAHLTGGFRPLAYLDPSNPRHATLKQLVFDLLAASGPRLIPSFRSAYSALFDSLEVALASSGPADFNTVNEATALKFVCDFLFGGAAPFATAHKKAIKWLLFQLHPLVTLGLPKLLEELFLHTFSLPSFLVRSDYKALASYFAEAAKPVLDEAEKTRGLSREETLHNLIFVAIFNAYGGIKLSFPGILSRLGRGWAGAARPARLGDPVRRPVRGWCSHRSRSRAHGADQVRGVGVPATGPARAVPVRESQERSGDREPRGGVQGEEGGDDIWVPAAGDEGREGVPEGRGVRGGPVRGGGGEEAIEVRVLVQREGDGGGGSGEQAVPGEGHRGDGVPASSGGGLPPLRFVHGGGRHAAPRAQGDRDLLHQGLNHRPLIMMRLPLN